MNHNYKGMFVTFEGLDFSGKSIQVKLLEKYSRSLRFNVVSHREPGGTLVGERIRNILLDKKNMGMCNETELLLFNAARGQYAQDLLIPALKRGDIFLSDRFYDSTTAYQGYGRGVHLDAIKLINGFATKGITPDITYLIDITVEESYRRKGTILEDRMESGGYEFYERVRNGYLTIAKEEPKRIKLIDGMKSIEECHAEIKQHFDKIFSLKFAVGKSVNQ